MRGRFRSFSILGCCAASLTLLAMSACEKEAEPENVLDAGYQPIYEEVMSAHRDSARNVRNKEARARKTAADRARLEFFQDPSVAALIETARAAPMGSFPDTRLVPCALCCASRLLASDPLCLCSHWHVELLPQLCRR